MKLPDLTGKQQAFVQHYLVCLNATQAARLAGYKGDDNALGVVGHRNLRNVKIRTHLEHHFNAAAMSAAEVIARLTEHARSDLIDLVNEQGVPDWERARRTGKTHLVKRIKRKEVEKKFERYTQTTVYTEIELHDPQRAMDMLGKYHELFTSKVKIEDWRSEAIAGIRDGSLTFEAMLGAGFERNLAVELFREAGVSVEISDGAPTRSGD